jgi:hypothetical protein
MFSDPVKFHEVQSFRQKWILALLFAVSLGLIIPFGYGMVTQLIFGHTWGSKPLPDIALAVVGTFTILFGVGLPWFFFSLRLITEVREDGLYIRFAPLTHQIIGYDDIVNCEVLTYKPIREYGGWGIRYGRSGKAYNVSGNRGVQLKLSNGKGLLIGSQHPEKLAQAIQAEMKR